MTEHTTCADVSDEDSNGCLSEFVIADLEPTASFTGPAGGSQANSDFDATTAEGAADRLTELVWDWETQRSRAGGSEPEGGFSHVCSGR